MTCAACRQRRCKCSPDCVLAPYFPADHPQQFLDVHHLFGVNNFLKIYNLVPPKYREDAVKSMIYEAMVRRISPVYGSAGVIHGLQTQIAHTERELYDVRRKLDFLRQRDQELQQVRRQSGQMQHGDWFPSYLPPPPPIARDTGESSVTVGMNPDPFEENFPGSGESSVTVGMNPDSFEELFPVSGESSVNVGMNQDPFEELFPGYGESSVTVGKNPDPFEELFPGYGESSVTVEKNPDPFEELFPVPGEISVTAGMNQEPFEEFFPSSGDNNETIGS